MQQKDLHLNHSFLEKWSLEETIKIAVLKYYSFKIYMRDLQTENCDDKRSTEGNERYPGGLQISLHINLPDF